MPHWTETDDEQRYDLINEVKRLRVELEQLRAENESYKASNVRLIRDGNELRAGLAALVDALPKCSQRWWDDPRGRKTPPDAWSCHDYATNVYIGADGDESYYCDAHFQHEYVEWAAPLRAALRLLNRKEEL